MLNTPNLIPKNFLPKNPSIFPSLSLTSEATFITAGTETNSSVVHHAAAFTRVTVAVEGDHTKAAVAAISPHAIATSPFSATVPNEAEATIARCLETAAHPTLLNLLRATSLA